MTTRTITKAELPPFEAVSDFQSLVGFFEARGISFDKRDNSFKITPHNRVRLHLVDEIGQEDTEQKRKQLLDSKIYSVGLVVDKSFQKFKFIRAKEAPNTFTFDKTKHYHGERLQSIYKLLNAISYSEKPYNESFLDIFEVKELVDRFYRDYRLVRDKLAKQIQGAPTDVEDLFAQVILDRIIFIYFLQAKGILAPEYLRALYELALERKKNFYDDYLQPLFFELLNSDDEEAKTKYQSEFGEIPYLNGGLFRRREFELVDTTIANAAWKPVFELFDGSEWVIEDTESGGLTPEVLGHIFEMSMNEGSRKSSGSYYTPREATRLICDQVITRLVVEEIEKRFRRKFESFEEVIRQNDKAILEFAYSLLRSIHLVDPAVGSGAFLVAAEKILVDYLLELYEKLERIGSAVIIETEKDMRESENSRTYHFKKYVMTQNLYGVDINPDGVELCKLRLWLSMITDIAKIEPLPNIEFNIRHGNSLIGFVERSADVGQSGTLDDLQSISTKVDELATLKQSYKQERNTKKAEEFKKRIDKLIMKYREDLNEKLMAKYRVDRYGEGLNIKHLTKVNEDLKQLQTEPWFLPFHWVAEFSEVFKTGGFDIVVGNPPFTRNELISADYKKFLSVMFSEYDKYESGQLGLYAFFVILCDKILKPEGRAAFVLPSGILRLESTEGLRNLLVERAQIEQIFIRTTKAAFSNDTSLREIILVFKKTASNDNPCRLAFVGDLTPKEKAISAAVSGDHQAEAIRTLTLRSDEIKNNTRNLFRLVAAQPDLLAIWNRICVKATNVLVKFSEYLSQTAGEMIRGVEIGSGAKISVLTTFILRDPAQALKSGDVWSVKETSTQSIKAVNRETGVTTKIPMGSVALGMRRPALVDRIDVSQRLDFIVVRDFAEAQQFFGTPQYRKALTEWQAYVQSRAAKLAIVRRLDISAPGSIILACSSSQEFTPAKMLYAVRGVLEEHIPSLALWFNSAVNILQLLLEREETRGALLNTSKYVLEDFLVADPRKLNALQRKTLNEVFTKYASNHLPSILEQLRSNSKERNEIDAKILQVLGFDDAEANQIVHELYPLLAHEIEFLKSVMQG